MVESVEDLPAELKISALAQMEVLGERAIQVPEAWRTNAWKSRSGGRELVSTVIVRVVVRPEALVASERRPEGGRVKPLRDLLFSGTAVAELGIADQVASARHLVPGAADGKRNPALGIKIPRKPPPAQDLVKNALSAQKAAAIA